MADSGYFNQTHLKTCAEEGITAYVPEPAPRGRAAKPDRLPRSAVAFDPGANGYCCPQGHWLQARREIEHGGKRSIGYASDPKDCAGCPLRSACLPQKPPYREIYRFEHEALLDAHRDRMAKEGDRYLRQRSSLAEHPFATLKRWCGFDHFLVRGKPKVEGEVNLLMLCYNFKRVLNILGIEGFRKYLAARAKTRGCRQRAIANAFLRLGYRMTRILTRHLTAIRATRAMARC